MIRVRLAFPAVVLLFSLSIPSAGQSFAETPSAPVVPRAQQAQPQSPAESSVIVVKPGLTDEQLADLYMARKEYQEAISSFRQALALDPQLFEHNSSRNGSILQDRSVGDRGRFYFLLAKSFAGTGNLERCLIYLRKAKDEGYKELSAVKSDPSFAAVLKDPSVQEGIAPRPPSSPQP